MFIDATVKSARANDRTSRILAANARKSIYGEAVRIPRELKDARAQVIEMANRGWDWDDDLVCFVPPYTNKFVVEVTS